jgi:alpha-tubulin suppressor-like RCC1 family protein
VKLGARSVVPVRVDIGGAAISGSHGGAHACALSDSGNVVCWGANDEAQARLGTPGEPAIAAPGTLSLGIGVKHIESSTFHNCVIRADGLVQCWGNPLGHKLGWNSDAHFMPPVPANQFASSYVSGAVDLGLSSHTSCALLASGNLVCWGWLWHAPYYGSYGYPPGVIASDVQAVNGGWYHLVVDGFFGPMGTAGSDCGQCGILSDFLEVFHPLGFPKGAQVAPGQLSTCARVGTNLFCLGDNRHGQLGIGGGCIDDLAPNDDFFKPICGLSYPSPQAVSLPGPVVDVSAGFSHTCALVATSSERIPYCFGEGALGELGPGATKCSSVPIAVSWPPEK